MDHDARQERLECGRKLVEKLDKTLCPHDQWYMEELRDIILNGDGAIYYIDAVNGDNSNDGLSAATAWRDRCAMGESNPGDIMVDNERVLIRRPVPWDDVLPKHHGGKI